MIGDSCFHCGSHAQSLMNTAKIVIHPASRLPTNQQGISFVSAQIAVHECSTPMQSTIHVYEVHPRKDKRGVDLISDALPSGGLWYAGPNAVSNAIGYAMHRSRCCDSGLRQSRRGLRIWTGGAEEFGESKRALSKAAEQNKEHAKEGLNRLSRGVGSIPWWVYPPTAVVVIMLRKWNAWRSTR